MPAKKKKQVRKASKSKSAISAPAYGVASKAIRNAVQNQLMTFNLPTYTDAELEYFEDAWATTPAGTALDKRMEFVIGGGIKPIFELKNTVVKDGKATREMTEEEKQEKLQQYNDTREKLIEYDELMNFNTKLYDAAVMAKVFGRSVILFENLLDDKSIGLPKSLKLVHSRNLSKVNIDNETWGIKDVKVMMPGIIAKPEEMIYLTNKPDSPIRHAIWFGYSEMQRVAGASRAYRRIVEFDMPEIATTMWAGSMMLLIKKMGRTKTNAQTDANNILNSIKAGTYNAIEVDALDEIDMKTLDLKPKVAELVRLVDFYERLMIGNSQTPSALLGREEDQNRATLIGKLRFFVEGPVKADREWLSDIISEQWYIRNIKKMGKEKILDEVRVKAEFEPIFTESWDDLVDSVLKLKEVIPIPDDKALDLLNLEELKDDIADQTKEEEKKDEEGKREILKASKTKERFFKDAMSYLQKVKKE